MVAEAQCDTCGETNAADASFCLFCGAYLGWDAAGPTGEQSSTEPGGSAAGAGPTVAPVEMPSRGPAQPPNEPPSTAQPPQPASPPPPTTRSATPTSEAPPSAGTAEIPRQPAEAAGQRCPQCGKDNDASLRFCARCGQPLRAATATPARSRPTASTTPARRGFFGRSEDRAARRAYRRSLPPLYRWRRVALSLLALAALVGLSFFVASGPVALVKQGWYALTDETVALEGVKAKASPEGRTVKPATNVVDANPSSVWARTWKVGSDDTTSCQEAEVAGAVELSWSGATRVRELRVDAGLRDKVNDRDKQHRPKLLLVSFRGPDDSQRSCVQVPLEDTADRQPVDVDTESEVESLTLSVGSVFPSKTKPEEDGLVSVRKVEVRTRP